MAERIVTARDGAVYWRGIYKDAADCALILAEFERSAQGGDYFASHARRIADELVSAMQAAGCLNSQEIAA